LQSVSFDIQDGEIVGFVGANGAGKTTTLKCVMGLLKSDYKNIEIDGKSLRDNYEDFLRSIVYMCDSNVFYNSLSAYDNLSILKGFYNKTKQDIIAMIEKVGLADRIDDNVGSYSFGMKQRLAIARCLLINPKVFMMDEPFNGLDIAGVASLRDTIKQIKQRGTTLLISSHNMAELVQVCDRMIVIERGRILGTITNDQQADSMERQFLEFVQQDGKIDISI